MSRVILHFLILCLTPIAVGHAADDDPKATADSSPSNEASDKAFQKVASKFRQRSRSAKPAERIEALHLLDDYPTADAAALVYDTLLANKSDDVRQAAIACLIAWRDRDEVVGKLLQRMTSATRKDGMSTRTISTLRVLGGAEDAALQKRILGYLDEFLGTSQTNQFLLHEMIDECAGKGDASEDLRLLRLFTRAKLFERHFGFRRCVVQGIMQVHDPETVSELIDLLPRFTGQVQFDVVSWLVATTGKGFGDHPEKWAEWWKENRGEAELNYTTQLRSFRNYGEFSEYYGIPICAKRIVFVIDTSMSMRGGKIEAAKVALIRAIRELKKDVSFNVIAFDGHVRLWQHELVLASESMKEIAVEMVQGLPLGPLTASYDALNAAFRLEPEAIYFLSDGAPVGGEITNPDEIVATISRANRIRRVSLHSIGIATTDSKRDVFGKFMKGLATPNWGVYKAVN